ncbi:membrane-associated phospholipid phosphatase [Paraburkholderia bannensis]|uniref:Membrane-associated phospholipid phosphatase n=1 Tax=Paraburkholderia bannensis TaxID=765414 RepID=A0A7W9WWM4_9BURK|nr:MULTISPECIES: phosphatase PAP2 family protein [Paraburkholderia]MBB3262167.1 membrane-associated phospholipid phosphatase [Paraburkholderia sp. WP4_3_2]MBB6107129.1 membrane-associated phospholipid phosphatase [Paraburkholderia bannensis]
MNTLRPRYGQHDAIAARNLSERVNPNFVRASVVLTAALIAFDIVAAKVTGFEIIISDRWEPIAINLICVVILFALSKMERYAALSETARLRRWTIALSGIAAMRIFLAASMVFQSLSVAHNAPLIDEALIGVDRRIGFHWEYLAAWYARHDHIKFFSNCLYVLWGPQVVVTVIVLSMKNRIRELTEFVFLFVVIASISIAISAFIPAANPFFHYRMVDLYGSTPWSQFYPLRDGTLRSVDLGLNQGLVSFPSMHAAAAVLFVYAVRHVKYFFTVSVVVNVLMTFAALYGGAHYLIDLFAG